MKTTVALSPAFSASVGETPQQRNALGGGPGGASGAAYGSPACVAFD